MIASLTEIELDLLDSTSREQVLAQLQDRRGCLPLGMTDEWLAQQSTSRLRLLVLAAKLIDVVWRVPCSPR
jgi:hypothetical protein